MKKVFCYFFIIGLVIFESTAFCSAKNNKKEVIIYTALDQVFSEPILHGFEKISGIKVKAVYDIEATKTTGMVNRLIAERNNPQCDVFWNNEVIKTIILKRKGVLQSYISPSSIDIPSGFKNSKGYWTGFAARARVIVYNIELQKDRNIPTSIFDFTLPINKNKTGIANPLFGTTSTHVAALFSLLGDKKAKKFFLSLKKNNIKIVDGNSIVKDMVGTGEILMGYTDTDDVNVGIKSGLPIAQIFPDKNGIGTLLIPNTVSLISNCPNPEYGKKLIDFLLDKKTEEKLAFSDSVQMPVRKDVKTPEGFVTIDQIKKMDVDFEKVADVMNYSIKFIQQIFIK